MIEDVLEPVELYQTLFKDAHARNTSEYFESLLQQSGVDEQANAATVRDLRHLEKQVADAGSSRTWWKIARGVVIGFAVLCGLMLFAGGTWLWWVGIAGAIALVFAKLNPLIKDVDQRHTELSLQRDATLQEAWDQMAPLNRLYGWDMVARLVQKTVPRLELDPYLANARLNELRNSFGWDDGFNEGRSVVFAHSGVLNGNPFVLAQTLDHWMGSKTYEGSLNISWTETVRDSNGKLTTVTRHQTLTASISRPFPEYQHRPVIIYGNEAAPDLTFSRNPSTLSKLEDGLINNWRKRRAVKQLEAKARKIEDGKGFTVMANREFDALFAATDRDHEVQFRLLFTPLAQQEMLKLLKDKEAGYGDDFRFWKQRMINIVEPEHMAGTDISADPAKFQAYELAQARRFFNEYHNDFFRSFFFGLAPLLVIPLYQQHRSHADIYKDVEGSRSCFWEHESIANYLGEERFQHPECVTKSILKTHALVQPDGMQAVRVSASGYGGLQRTEYVSVYGGDNRYHDVPVHWVEYYDVQKESDLLVQESTPSSSGDSWEEKFRQRGIDPSQAVLRRSIFAAKLG